MYSWEAAKNSMRRCRKRSSPVVPSTLKELASQFESQLLNQYQACDELIYKGIFMINVFFKHPFIYLCI